RAPVPRLPARLEGCRQRHGELVERLDLRSEWRHGQPFRRPPPEPGYDARADERRLAASRGAEEEQEARSVASLAPQGIQGLEGALNVIAATEEDRRV